MSAQNDTDISALVNSTILSLSSLSINSPQLADVHRNLESQFRRMCDILFTKKDDAVPSEAAMELVRQIGQSAFIFVGFSSLLNLTIEERKQFTIIFTGSISQCDSNGSFPVAEFISQNVAIIDTLLAFYEKPELAVPTGEMLRLCAKHEKLAEELLRNDRVEMLFSYFSAPNFDVSADSFATFRFLLLNAPQAEDYIRSNSNFLIGMLHSTLVEENYAGCRQTLKLIGEIIISYQSFQEIYLEDQKNLMVIMDLMVSNYHNIAMEAFHIFKLFVVNENKPDPILNILKANADKLIPYIDDLLGDTDDEDLKVEKQYLLMQLRLLIPK